MPEQLAYDKDAGGLVRWRAMFEMPNWEGVTEDEITHVIDSSSERLDKLAYRYWGEERQELYWVIAARNSLDLPDVELYEGRKIKIPSKQWIDNKFLPQMQKYRSRGSLQIQLRRFKSSIWIRRIEYGISLLHTLHG
jgi:hypothetical protein